MTKEETKAAIAVMQAYVDGEEIQVRKDEDLVDWADYNEDDEPSWGWNFFEYRVKPKPKLRPYTFDEMCKAVKEHGVLVKTIGADEIMSVTGFDNEQIFYVKCIESYDEFMRSSLWFDDGSPCGIMEE